MRIAVNQLGLAAFIKMKNAQLVAVEGKSFVFETEISLQEWRIQYNNSCCMRHDTLLCELRHHLKEPLKD